MSTTIRIAATGALVTFLTLVLALPGAAHVGLDPSEVPAGSGTTLSFRVGHGCDGDPTTEVSLQIPAGVASVRPFPKAGWELRVETGTLPEPIVSGDQEITEGVTVVNWSGGSLEDAHTDIFQIRATLYGDPGDRIYFPIVQRCPEGGEYAWIEIPAEGQDGHDLPTPAPGLTLTASGSGGHGDAAEDTAGQGDDVLVLIAIGLGILGIAIGSLALVANLRTRSQ